MINKILKIFTKLYSIYFKLNYKQYLIIVLLFIQLYHYICIWIINLNKKEMIKTIDLKAKEDELIKVNKALE